MAVHSAVPHRAFVAVDEKGAEAAVLFTVWYDPCIDDPEAAPPIRFHPENRWFRTHMGISERGLPRSQGRYLVAMPDLIENLDTLAALRGTEPLLMDMLERPEWVR